MYDITDILYEAEILECREKKSKMVFIDLEKVYDIVLRGIMVKKVSTTEVINESKTD